MKAGHDQVETVQQDWEGKGHSLQLVESSINSVWSPHSVASSYLSECEVKVTQSCLTPCNPVNYTLHGILQARILEWVAFPFSRGSSQPRDRTQVSHIGKETQTDSLPAEPQVFGLKGTSSGLTLQGCPG